MTIRNSDGTLACICHEHKAMCDCASKTLPVVTSPPLAPIELNASQAAFLAFHNSRHMVMSWRWHFIGATLRATNERGDTATIWKDDVDALVEAGLMRRGSGCADCSVTAVGREYLEANREVRT